MMTICSNACIQLLFVQFSAYCRPYNFIQKSDHLMHEARPRTELLSKATRKINEVVEIAFDYFDDKICR